MFRNAKDKVLFIFPVALAGAIFAANVSAATISNGNSSVTLNPTAVSNAVPFISQWIVDGVDQYGGSPAGGESLGFYLGSNPEVSINTLPVLSSSFGSGVASVSYQGTGFTIAVTDVLTGGNSGSGSSAIGESVVVNNTSGSPLAFSLADFVNLNVDATPADDTLTLGSNSATQTDPLGTSVNFSVTPAPVIQASSTNGGNTYLETGPTVVHGDVAFAFLWGSGSGADTIDAGGTAIYSINETATGVTSGGATSSVPLPNSAGAALATLKKQKKRKQT